MHTSTATLERPRPHPDCTCPTGFHSAWDIAPRAVGPHGPPCPLGSTPSVPSAHDVAEQDTTGVSADLWLG